MKVSSRWFGYAVSTLVLSTVGLAGINNANAAVIPLTGGESTDGWVAPSTYLLAYHVGEATNLTVQGVTFLGWADPTTPQTPTGFTVTATGASAGGPYAVPTWSGGTDNDDTDLANVMHWVFYDSPGPLTLTISGTGLTAGTYRVDEFYQESNQTRTLTFSINGVPVDTLAASGTISRLISNNVTIGAGGPITLTVAGAGGAPSFGGFVISAVPTPEPSTISLLLLGVVFTLARRPRRSGR